MKVSNGYIYDYKIGFRIYVEDIFEASGYGSMPKVEHDIVEIFQDKFDKIHKKFNNVVVSIQDIDTEYDDNLNDIFLVLNTKVVALDDNGVKTAKKIMKCLNKMLNKWNRKGWKARSCRKTYNELRKTVDCVGYLAYLMNVIDRRPKRVPAYDGVVRF